MDSERNYNKALEIAAQQLEFWGKRGVREKAAARMAIEAIFPQLKESEDEKIRRELKEAFESYDIESKWNGIPIRSIFAWLEKQKEQKPSEEQQEVDLEKEIDAYLEPIKALQIQEAPYTSMENTARHFYQLGLNARKEDSHE